MRHRQASTTIVNVSSHTSPQRTDENVDDVHEASAASNMMVPVGDSLIVFDPSTTPPAVYPVPDPSLALYGATPYDVSVEKFGVIVFVNRASLTESFV